MQKEVFKEIREEREHVCFVCGVRVDTTKAITYSHVLGKGAYPAYKLVKDNIVLMCARCHNQWDFGIKSDPKFDDLRAKEQELKERYFSLK